MVSVGGPTAESEWVVVARSSLLVLDEAFDGLDKDSRAELQSVLEAVFEDKSKTLVPRKRWIFCDVFTAQNPEL